MDNGIHVPDFGLPVFATSDSMTDFGDSIFAISNRRLAGIDLRFANGVGKHRVADVSLLIWKGRSMLADSRGQVAISMNNQGRSRHERAKRSMTPLQNLVAFPATPKPRRGAPRASHSCRDARPARALHSTLGALRALMPHVSRPRTARLASLGGTLVCLGMGVLPQSAHAQRVTFAPKADYASGSTPLSVVSGDFNKDGVLDLAVANQGSDSVSVLLGNGSGGFNAKTDYPTNFGPRSVVSGDFNKDGNLDLAVANQGSDSVSVLLGNGGGGFGTKTDYATAFTPLGVVSGDFNNDGNLDLATANTNGDSVSVLLGNGNGSFGTKTDYPTLSGPTFVTSGDFNKDGNLDLVANSGNGNGNSVSVLLGNGSGGFGTKTDYVTGPGPSSVTSGDFNKDGNLDFAVANTNASTVSVLLGNGSGGFGTKTDYATGANPSSVTSGDFNKDGNLDLATANITGNSVSVLPGNGSGVFGTKTDYPTGAVPFSVTSGDFNQDGKLDLATANYSDSTASVLLNTTAPAPIANDVSGETVTGKPVGLVLSSDTPGATYEITSGPGNGTAVVAVNSDGQTRLFYRSNSGVSGTDTVQFVAIAPDGTRSQPATATIIINFNDVPFADPVNGNVASGVLFVATLTGSDHDDNDAPPAKFGLVTLPAHGTASIAKGSDGVSRLYYRSNNGYVGTDTFQFRAVDKQGAYSDPATATIQVTSNAAPTTQDVSGSVPSDKLLALKLSGTDPDGSIAGYKITRQPLHGRAAVSRGSDGAFVLFYRSDAGYVGSDSIGFVAIGSKGARSAVANASITVTGAPSADSTGGSGGHS